MSNDNSGSTMDSENGKMADPQSKNKENVGSNSSFESNFKALHLHTPLAQSTPLRRPNATRMIAHPYSQMSRGQLAIKNRVPLMNLPDWEVQFGEVVGRMSMSGKHYPVTLAEVKRRIDGPELLNQSLLNSFFRKAKDKQGGDNLSNKLAKHGIDLQQGRRKTAPTTSFTALCEGEAQDLIKDYRAATQQYFPAKDLAYEQLADIKTVEELYQMKNGINSMQYVLHDILSVISKDVSPVCNLPTNMPSMMHPKSQEAFSKYSALTHGFGMGAHRVAWEAYGSTLAECHKAFSNPKSFLDKIGRPPPQSLNAIIHGAGKKQEGPSVSNFTPSPEQMQMMATMMGNMDMPNMSLPTNPNMCLPNMNMPMMPPTKD